MAGLLGTLRRGLLSVLRAPGRTLLLAGLLAVSIGLGGSMLAVSGAISQRAQEVQDEIRPQVTVRPAGTFGFAGGGEPLLEEDLAFLGDLPQVVSVDKQSRASTPVRRWYQGLLPGAAVRRGATACRSLLWGYSQGLRRYCWAAALPPSPPDGP